MSALFSLLYKQCTNPNFGSPDAERTTLLFGFAVFGQLCGSFIGITMIETHSEGELFSNMYVHEVIRFHCLFLFQNFNVRNDIKLEVCVCHKLFKEWSANTIQLQRGGNQKLVDVKF